MGASVVAGVESSAQSVDAGTGQPPPAIRIRMLGPLAIERDGSPLVLPASRKVRALFAHLALAPRPLARSRLCEMFWDVPNDPRGELRWCLSKIRGLVDEPGRRRVHAHDDAVGIDLSDCDVDALVVDRLAEEGMDRLDARLLQSLAMRFRGDFLERLELDRSPIYEAWLTAQRRRFRSHHAALLGLLVERLPEGEAYAHLETWLQLSPFDRVAHELLLGALARSGRIREGEEHLSAATRLFEAEGLESAPLQAAWREARLRARSAAEAPTASTSLPSPFPLPPSPPSSRRASLAVMPFDDASTSSEVRGGLGDALAHDVITRLAKLRSLFVIAQGTVFALHERKIGAQEAGRMLHVDYAVGGSVRRDGGRLVVSVELAETQTARIVWAETFNHGADDPFSVLDEIGNMVVSSIANEIETLERNRAILRPPDSLDAWEAHHRGLWHMYRFSKPENEAARHFFEAAVRLDPTFARAWAGLSFTHFQNAFQGWTDREPEMQLAYETAGQSLMADDRDPAAHWAMGRALWLRGGHEPAIAELERAIDLSPNFALGHYTLAFVHSQAGDPRAAIVSADYSRHLSPFDPLLFGMLGARAMALVRLGEVDEACAWANLAAARPNAHPHIIAIAAFTHALAGSLDAARAHAATLRRTVPGYTADDFLAAFRFDETAAQRFREGAKRIGMAGRGTPRV